MIIGIIVAMGKELDLLLPLIQDLQDPTETTDSNSTQAPWAGTA